MAAKMGGRNFITPVYFIAIAVQRPSILRFFKIAEPGFTRGQCG